MNGPRPSAQISVPAPMMPPSANAMITQMESVRMRHQKYFQPFFRDRVMDSASYGAMPRSDVWYMAHDRLRINTPASISTSLGASASGTVHRLRMIFS